MSGKVFFLVLGLVMAGCSDSCNTKIEYKRYCYDVEADTIRIAFSSDIVKEADIRLIGSNKENIIKETIDSGEIEITYGIDEMGQPLKISILPSIEKKGDLVFCRESAVVQEDIEIC